MKNNTVSVQEKLYKPTNGWLALIASIVVYIAATVGVVFFGIAMDTDGAGAIEIIGFVITIVYICVGWIWWLGLKVIRPNEALVLTLFGKYIGTIKTEGFYYVNPFCIAVNPTASAAKSQLKTSQNGVEVNLNSSVSLSRKISLKTMTHINGKQKINDELGNPIEVGIVIIWRVCDTAKAVFNVENYSEFLSTQADSVLRDVVRRYPYDSTSAEEQSLRASSAEIADILSTELAERVEFAGLEVIEARITHLAYAPEIAAAMLQRQQATAIIEARQKIVDGAVGMVQMALDKINEDNICSLDDERKAQMVSNLLVVLCGNRDAQPIVNTGSIY